MTYEDAQKLEIGMTVIVSNSCIGKIEKIITLDDHIIVHYRCNIQGLYAAPRLYPASNNVIELIKTKTNEDKRNSFITYLNGRIETALANDMRACYQHAKEAFEELY